MQIQENYSLRPLNTFGLDASAEYFSHVYTIDQLFESLAFAKGKNLFILGGGSNILLTKDIPGLTVKIGLQGIELLREDDDFYYVKAASGENWHQLVMHCVANGYAGVENLSLIPGNAGAGPMQNIGAYGVELKDVFHELEALHILTLEKRIFSLDDCQFGYRTSIFKTAEKGNYILLSVTLKLRKKPVFHTAYGAITEELERAGVTDLSIRAVSDAVVRIRRSKLPDPAEIGNAGSFFKNPVISKAIFESLLEQYPGMAYYPQPDGNVKIAAGWLIEKAGWKGKTIGAYGVHKNQALVLVNYGGASGEDIFNLSEDIIHDIREKFGIELEREVNLV